MKKIEIDDELYHFIASNTQSIGESASDILRRLLKLEGAKQSALVVSEQPFETDLVSTEVNEHKCDNVFNILNKEELAMQKGVVGRFLFILSALQNSQGYF